MKSTAVNRVKEVMRRSGGMRHRGGDAWTPVVAAAEATSGGEGRDGNLVRIRHRALSPGGG